MDKAAFLKIALFDIWLINDDRNEGNNNLLIRSSDNQIKPIAIDHEKIFNTGNLERGIFELSYTDSMLYSGLYHRMLPRSSRSNGLIEENIASLHGYLDSCHEQLDAILADIPNEWNIQTQELKSRLHHNIFTENWVSITERTFREFASLCISS